MTHESPEHFARRASTSIRDLAHMTISGADYDAYIKSLNECWDVLCTLEMVFYRAENIELTQELSHLRHMLFTALDALVPLIFNQETTDSPRVTRFLDSVRIPNASHLYRALLDVEQALPTRAIEQQWASLVANFGSNMYCLASLLRDRSQVSEEEVLLAIYHEVAPKDSPALRDRDKGRVKQLCRLARKQFPAAGLPWDIRQKRGFVYRTPLGADANTNRIRPQNGDK